jgi:hypothetical protein
LGETHLILSDDDPLNIGRLASGSLACGVELMHSEDEERCCRPDSGFDEQNDTDQHEDENCAETKDEG